MYAISAVCTRARVVGASVRNVSLFVGCISARISARWGLRSFRISGAGQSYECGESHRMCNSKDERINRRTSAFSRWGLYSSSGQLGTIMRNRQYVLAERHIDVCTPNFAKANGKWNLQSQGSRKHRSCRAELAWTVPLPGTRVLMSM